MNPAEFHSLRQFAETDLGRIAYLERGDGPPALFLHALPLCGYQWRGVIDDLVDVRRCLAPDLMGLGYTEVRPGQEISYAEQARMVAAFLDALGIERVDLCGNDTGGGVSQIFAATYPERVRSLMLTNCEVHDRWPNNMLTQFYQAMEAGLMAEGVKSMLADIEVARAQFAGAYEYPAALSPEVVRTYLEPLIGSEERLALLRKLSDWKTSRSQLMQVAPRLSALQVPAQVIWADADTAFDVQPSLEWLRANLGGLRKVTTVPHAKLFFVEEHPRLVSVLLRELWSSAN